MAPLKSLKSYRVLQLLSSRFNATYSTFVVNITVVAVGTIIVGTYGTVKFYDQLHLSRYSNFVLNLVMLGLFILVFFPRNAAVYEESEGEMTRVLRKRFTDQAWMDFDYKEPSNALAPSGSTKIVRLVAPASTARAFKSAVCIARSCPAQGISFGGFYYIKNSTTLTIVDFTACNTISTLLAYP